MAAIRNEIAQFSREIGLQGERSTLSRESAERLRQLQSRGFASLMQVQQQQEAELEQRGRRQTLERTRSERQRELVELQAEYDELPLRELTQISELSRGVALLEQELAQSEARREIVIAAPQSGTVTAIQAESGGNATPATALMSIVPEGATLNAQLFASSKAVGFVRPGQKALLRYQSYPYQKFGHHIGVIESVSKSAVSPTELPAQLTGLSSLIGTNEGIYRITVRLDRQSVLAYGVDQPLQPGMQLDSDVLLDRRKLWEWMLEPLFTLSGRL
jgi:membrane fusion protein